MRLARKGSQGAGFFGSCCLFPASSCWTLFLALCYCAAETAVVILSASLQLSPIAALKLPLRQVASPCVRRTRNHPGYCLSTSESSVRALIAERGNLYYSSSELTAVPSSGTSPLCSRLDSFVCTHGPGSLSVPAGRSPGVLPVVGRLVHPCTRGVPACGVLLWILSHFTFGIYGRSALGSSLSV